ncbi:GFA family protein [Pelagovum pacificum]|uniref:GFA family protein n=1 Tax=Pelagovum pacificum TaxID=2588711 RepID=A0A5C5GJP0_9RHOB|nr:GFA family protein [Pelagovum pacificum]
MCGAVKFTAKELGPFGICHCGMCQRWLGSAMFGVTVPEKAMEIEGAEHVGSRRSSDWATRCWCTECGSSLWYRYDKGRDGQGDYEVPLGLFDDRDGLTLRREIYFDRKSDSWSVEGSHERLTEAQTTAIFG